MTIEMMLLGTGRTACGATLHRRGCEAPGCGQRGCEINADVGGA